MTPMETIDMHGTLTGSQLVSGSVEEDLHTKTTDRVLRSASVSSKLAT
jgi:hypothetical protein